jgi:hypothetical protein
LHTATKINTATVTTAMLPTSWRKILIYLISQLNRPGALLT